MEIINKTASVLFQEIFNPAVYLFSTACFVWFLFGVGKFLWARYSNDQDGIKKGKNHMLWGLIGLIIIFSASAIFNIITNIVD